MQGPGKKQMANEIENDKLSLKQGLGVCMYECSALTLLYGNVKMKRLWLKSPTKAHPPVLFTVSLLTFQYISSLVHFYFST